MVESRRVPAARLPRHNRPMSWDFATTYATLRAVHMALAAASVGFFALRWVAVLRAPEATRAWPMRTGVRRSSSALDTLLLLAGVGLWVLMQHDPLREPWLLAKLLLLPLYVVLGTLALRRARTRAGKGWFGVAALLVVGLMALSAVTRLPLGLATLSG
jgi:uncharacterized membrane protein SirB2